MTIYTHSVYWIHFPNQTDITSHGYVGVSNNPNRRITEHRNPNNDKNKIFNNILQKHSLEITQTIIFQGTEEACYLLEEELRPLKNIGWNINKGGTKPPSKKGWTPSDITLERRSNSLRGIPRSKIWRDKLSKAKQGPKNGMYGRKIPCSTDKKILIIRTKNEHRINDLIRVFELLKSGETIRNISKLTGYGTTAIVAIKKNPELHFEAFPILKQFKTT
jgi:hypothetical protein